MNQEEVLNIVRTIGPCTVPQIVAYTKDGYISHNDRTLVYQRLRALERWGDVRRVGLDRSAQGHHAVIWDVVE